MNPAKTAASSLPEKPHDVACADGMRQGLPWISKESRFLSGLKPIPWNGAANGNLNANPSRNPTIRLETAPVMHPAALFAICFLAAFALGLILFR